MEHHHDRSPDERVTAARFSTVRVVVDWFLAADREYRAVQSIVNETHEKLGTTAGNDTAWQDFCRCVNKFTYGGISRG